ncbi:hypothetical protein LCGC14_1365140 [marine sediment metagenome]|uniref:Uncharacterized protein n=1 Tax=marine sediment metagenome TaxID=412755 RepID=A0A0F9N929_9ZZZZ
MDDYVTGTMYLDSNELEQQPAHTFLTKWTFNNKICGTGKTKKGSENIKYFVKKSMKILVCLSNHRLIEEFIEWMEIWLNWCKILFISIYKNLIYHLLKRYLIPCF